MGGKAKFKKGQRCLVPYVDRHYAARILQAQKTEDTYLYRLHYEGWSNKYDEWVEEEGLLKYDPALIPVEEGGTGPPAATASGESPATAGMEQDSGAATGATAGPSKRGGPGGADRGPRKGKAEQQQQQHQGGVEAPPDNSLPPQLRLHLPPLLKKVVLDDHDQVTHQCRVQPLPRRPSVADILRDFERSKAPEGGAADQSTAEVVNGLRSYFDHGLRQLLLYSQEVQHHDEAVARGQPASGVYGGEHLVRLLVKLPELVPVATMGPQNVQTLEGRLHELMAMLVEQQAQYFLPSSGYIPNPHIEPPPLPAVG